MFLAVSKRTKPWPYILRKWRKLVSHNWLLDRGASRMVNWSSSVALWRTQIPSLFMCCQPQYAGFIFRLISLLVLWYFSYLQTSTGENILFHPVYVFFFIYSRSIFKVFAYYSLLTSVLGIWSLSLSVGCSVVSRQVPLSMEFSRQEYWSG